MSPFCGSWPMRLTNSFTKAIGSFTLKVKIRMWPNVPDGVSTCWALNTLGIVVAISPWRSSGAGSSAWTACSWATTRGANNSTLARPTSSASRSSP